MIGTYQKSNITQRNM